MTTVQNVEKQILELESQRMKAMTEADTDTLKKIYADDLTYTHTSAAKDTKQSMIEALETGRLNYTAMDASDVKIRVYGDTAILTGKAKVEVVSGGNALTFGLIFTDVYTKKDGQWQMVAWQSTRLPE